MSLDTTSNNNGINTDACVLLETNQNKPSQFSISTLYTHKNLLLREFPMLLREFHVV